MEGTNGFTSVNPHATTIPTPSNHSTSPSTHSAPAPASAPPAPAGTKRKRESVLKFYAVRVGKEPGIYHTWADCLGQVRGFPKAAFKSFTSLAEAQAFVDDTSGGSGGGAHGGKGGVGAGKAGGSKWYGVQNGRKPGVYASWPEVLDQITGWKGPKHKVFKTRLEAEMFVAEGQKNAVPIAMNMTNGDGSGEAGGLEDLDNIDVAMNGSVEPAKKAQKKKDGAGGGKDAKLPHASAAAATAAANGVGEYEPGEGPLPSDAEDDFDPTITLDHSTSNLRSARYKSASELAETTYAVARPILSAPIKIYTDGSALSNGQSAAIGGVGVYFGPLDKRNLSEPLTGTKQTNQRAELTAILRALEVAPRDRKVIIYSDSKYAINCVSEWFLKWRSRGWVNASNKPVENKDLIQKVIDMLEERFRLNKHRILDEGDEAGASAGANVDDAGGTDREVKGHWDHGPASVKFVWVKGHAKNEGNNAADELAVNAARTARELGEDVELD